MFSISREASKSLTFCVIPVGMPPHLRNRFQISTRICRCLLFLEQKVELVHVVARRLVLGTVDGHAVPDLILHNEHPQLLELLSELLDVIADEAVIHIHIRPVIEDIQRAMHIDFKGSGNPLCLRLTLTAQDVVEVFENRHLLRDRIGKVVLIHLADAAVDDGLFHRLQPILRRPQSAHTWRG